MAHRSDDLIVACPDCDSASVKRNVCTDLQGPNRDNVSRYKCEDCGTRFQEFEAVHRERKVDVLPRKDSVARTLHDAHPDDLATDGGIVEDAMPRLTFANEYVAPIIYGEKTATVRVNGPDLELHDRVKATDEDGRMFATLEIRGLAHGDVFDVLDILEVFDAEYGADTPHDVLDGLRGHYDRPITPSTHVDIYVFDHARLPGDDDGGDE